MLSRILAAAVAGGVTFFILGFIIYGVILDPLVMKPNVIAYEGLMKDPPSWIPLILGNLVSGLLLAYIIDRLPGVRSFTSGAMTGGVVWFLMSLAFQLMFLAFMNLTKSYVPVIADVVGSAVMGAIGGGVIAAVMGMMDKRTAVIGA